MNSPMPIYIHRDGQQLGPYTVEQARDYLESGNLVAEDLAWYEGAEDWMPLGQIPGLSAPAAAPARSSAPDWVPPRRDELPSEPAVLPGQISRTAPSAISASAAATQPGARHGNPSAAPAPVPQAAPGMSPSRGGYDPYRSALRAAGIRNMGIGGLFFVGGSAVTVISYEAAAEDPHGGTYFMAWGAIVFGGIQLVKGIIQFCKA